MPKIRIKATEQVAYDRIFDVSDDELIDLELELTAHDTYPDRTDFGLVAGDGDSRGLENIEIEILKG